MIANTFFISPGDVLYRRKGLFFEHVGVYLGWNLVFQNTPKAGEHVVTLADFTQGHPYRVRRTGVPQHLLNWRTQLRLQQPRRYNLLLNNCEHTASALLKEAMERLPEKIYQAPQVSIAPSMEIAAIPAPDDIKPNAYALIETDLGTQVAVREGNELVPIPDLASSVANRIRGMVRLRNRVRECLRSQVDNAPDTEILQARTHLNQEYDRF